MQEKGHALSQKAEFMMVSHILKHRPDLAQEIKAKCSDLGFFKPDGTVDESKFYTVPAVHGSVKQDVDGVFNWPSIFVEPASAR